MIVTIDLNEPYDSDDAPVTIQLGNVAPQGKLGEPELLIQWGAARFSLDDLRDHLRELEATRDKYREIMSALGRAT
jgi:hypothetical protein